MKRHKSLSLIFILILLLAGCFSVLDGEPDTVSNDDLEGQILIWHTWQGQEQIALRELLDGFMELHPNVSIVEEFYDIDAIGETYRYQIEAGLGPDILIAPASWAQDLADERLIQDISSREDVDLDIYLTAALDMLRYNDAVYGLPLTLNTQVLYYNKSLLRTTSTEGDSNNEAVIALIQEQQATITHTETLTALDQIASQVATISDTPSEEAVAPASTLDELLQQASHGHTVAFPADFYNAFWGIQTFGGELFDEEERVILNQGGFANWLNWLKQANENPNIILNRNLDELNLLFTTGRATYYVGSTQEYPALQAALGPENVGVIRLPGRQNKPAGPFLQAEALMFNQATTPNSADLSLRLAQYLTNAEQQRKLALAVGKLPTNNRVDIDPRVSAVVAEFIAQSKTAVPVELKDIEKLTALIDLGDDAYAQALEGEVRVGDAATTLTEQVNEQYDVETMVTRQRACEAAGTITLWNPWREANEAALEQIIEAFGQQCPEAAITVESVEAAELLTRYLESIEQDEAPDVIIGTNFHINNLASQEALLNLSEGLDPDFSQRLIPLVEEAVLYQDNLYGVPLAIDLMAMYYNVELVDTPPVVLNDLVPLASAENQVAVPINFLDSYWGIAAFGESGQQPIFDEEGRLLLGDLGLTEWLAWLKEAQTTPGMVLSADKTELQTLFVEQQAGLLVGDTTQLKTLRTELGAEQIGVVPLPSGSPILEVDTLLLSPFSSPDQQAVALELAQFMTDIQSQEILLTQTDKIPININVSTADYPVVEGFIEQTNGATVLPNVSETQAMLEWGNVVYEQVLDNDIAPADAVQDFVNLVDATNGIAITETVVIEDCPDEGEITLWHSWNEPEQLAWQTVITDFAEVCPGIQINPVLIPEETFTEQLTQTLEADSEIEPPDFFVGPHTNLEAYQDASLIRDISPLVDSDKLIDFLPRGISAFSRAGGEELYGLPQTISMPALYYNQDLVEEPAATFAGLLEQAESGLSVAMPIGFYDLLWGASAFGCEPCLGGNLFDDQGELLLNPAALSAWQDWLNDVDDSEQFIFSEDQAALQQRFLAGEVAYLVAKPDFLNEAQEELGTANVGIVPLPVGAEEEQPARPILDVDGFYFFQEATDEQTMLALKFVEFATTEAQQTSLMQAANFIPTRNIALVTADDPLLNTFISEIDNTILLPTRNQRSLIEESPVYRTFDNLTDDLADESTSNN